MPDSHLRASSLARIILKTSLYQTITGRRLNLENLSVDERKFLLAVEKQYRTQLGWTEFASWWLSHFTESRLPADSLVCRICQDLEARLGIAEGKVALPAYRDYLADLIEERYGSRYNFCKETGIDPGQLSRVFAVRAELSLPALEKVLQVLNAALIIRREDDLGESFSPREASRILKVIKQNGLLQQETRS